MGQEGNRHNSGEVAVEFKYDLGRRIRMFREEAGLSQEELSQELGVSRGAIVRYEQGHIPMNRLEPLCEALNRYLKNPIAPRDLIPEETPRPPVGVAAARARVMRKRGMR
jgi:transcriptional regulator with XRE-family HTH domain